MSYDDDARLDAEITHLLLAAILSAVTDGWMRVLVLCYGVSAAVSVILRVVSRWGRP